MEAAFGRPPFVEPFADCSGKMQASSYEVIRLCGKCSSIKFFRSLLGYEAIQPLIFLLKAMHYENFPENKQLGNHHTHLGPLCVPIGLGH